MNLDRNIELDFKRFIRWWGRELSFLVPDKARQWLSDQSGYVFVTVNEGVLQFNQIYDGNQQIVAELPLNELNSENYARLRSERIELEKGRLVLRLNNTQAIAKNLFLPAATKENLNQVVAFELDRYTPFKAEQVYFSVKYLGKEQNGQIRVLVVLTPKATLDELLLELGGAGIHPFMVDFAGAPNDLELDPYPYDLLPDFEKTVVNKTTRALTGLSIIVTVLLFIAVFVYPVWYQSRTVQLLKQQVASLEKEARLVQASQLEIDNIVGETERLIKTKNNSPLLNELINTVSLLMPDDTSLTHLNYNNGRLQIQGQSPAASALIAVLEASPLFSNVRFVSPVTRDRRTGLERFQISVDVASERDGDGER